MPTDYSCFAQVFVTMDAPVWPAWGVAGNSQACATGIVSSLRDRTTRRQNREHESHQN
jgi:hypothetical protein